MKIFVICKKFSYHQKKWLEIGNGDKYVFLQHGKEPVFLDTVDYEFCSLDDKVTLIRRVDLSQRTFEDFVFEGKVNNFYVGQPMTPAPGATKQFNFSYCDGSDVFDLGSFTERDVAEQVFDSLDRFKKRAKIDEGDFIITEEYNCFLK